MHNPIQSPATLLANKIRTELHKHTSPLIVALDGRSGCGKSTIAKLTSNQLNANEYPATATTIIGGDQFYSGGSATTWDSRSPAENAAMAFDWRKQQLVLESLRAVGHAYWQSFDWHSDAWARDEPPLTETRRCNTTPVILFEGIYTARPELAHLVDLRVLLLTPDHTRYQQLLKREGQNVDLQWHKRWSLAENYYFANTVQTSGFQLLLGQAATA